MDLTRFSLSSRRNEFLAGHEHSDSRVPLNGGPGMAERREECQLSSVKSGSGWHDHVTYLDVLSPLRRRAPSETGC